jgi:hypothetical protein
VSFDRCEREREWARPRRQEQLAANIAAAKAKEAALKQTLTVMRSATAQIFFESTNEEATARLEK